jgi:hypothetical protein
MMPLLLAAAAVAPDPSCHHRPAFAAIEARAAAKAPGALAQAYAYAADPAHDDPTGTCEAIAVDGLIATLERDAVSLSVGNTHLHPDAAFHCTAFDPRTTACNGLVADGTAQPQDATAPRPAAPAKATLASGLGDARLIGLYRTTIAAALDGKPAVPLPTGPTVTLGRVPPATVLVAIYTAPAPYHYRKLVWYFR